LTHLAAQHLVAGARIALHVDPAHIDALAGIDEKGHRDLVFCFIDLGDGIHVGEGIALVAQQIGNPLGAFSGRLARKELAALELDQREQLLRRHRGLARQLDVTDTEGLAFIDDDRDINLFLVGADRDLSRLDVEFDIAAIQIEGAQRFQIAGEFLLGILIVLGIEGVPAGRSQLELFAQFVGGKGFVADDVDLLDAGGQALR
jgi:hypothetical protein